MIMYWTWWQRIQNVEGVKEIVEQVVLLKTSSHKSSLKKWIWNNVEAPWDQRFHHDIRHKCANSDTQWRKLKIIDMCKYHLCETYEWITRKTNCVNKSQKEKWYVVQRLVKKNISDELMCKCTTRMLAYMHQTPQRWVAKSGMSMKILAWRKHKQVGCYPRITKFTKWTHLLTQEDYKWERY